MLTRMYNHLLNGSGYKYVTIQRAWDQTSNIDSAQWGIFDISSPQWAVFDVYEHWLVASQRRQNILSKYLVIYAIGQQWIWQLWCYAFDSSF